MAATVIPIPLGMVKVFLLRGKKDVLVDAGMPGSPRRILAALRRLGVDPGRISLLIVTHGHADHIGGLHGLASEIDCPVAIHEGDAEALRRGTPPVGAPVGAMTRLLKRLMPRLGSGRIAAVQPGIELKGSFDLKPYGIDGVVEHTPGHTAGSVSLFLGAGDAIVGDLLRGSILSPRAPAWPFVAEDLAEVRRSIGRVLDRNPKVIWTSHGGPLEANAVRAFLKRES
jgi:hydroxyacylglutathione hydrolase